jgi:hypothetical protein
MDTMIDDRFKRAGRFFSENAASLVIATLLVCLGMALVLPGPWMALNLLGEIVGAEREGRPVRWQATYERISTFFSAWGLALVAGSAIGLGLAFCVVPGVLLAIVWFHAPVLVAQGQPVLSALGTSYRALRSQGDWIATLLNGLILVACAAATSVTAVLTVVALPIALIYLALCTRDADLACHPVTHVDGRPIDQPA